MSGKEMLGCCMICLIAMITSIGLCIKRSDFREEIHFRDDEYLENSRETATANWNIKHSSADGKQITNIICKILLVICFIAHLYSTHKTKTCRESLCDISIDCCTWFCSCYLFVSACLSLDIIFYTPNNDLEFTWKNITDAYWFCSVPLMIALVVALWLKCSCNSGLF